MIGTASSRRRVRAEAAQTLLRLHESDALAEPERWTWDVVDRLPLWCLLDAEQRQRVQRVAGAVLLAPEMRLWIEAPLLDEAERLLGETTLQAVLQRADALAQSPDGQATVAHSSVAMSVQALHARLMSAGASVLAATLHESLPLASLADTLGERAGELPPEVAALLLAEAENIIATVLPTASDSDASLNNAAA